MSNLQVPGRRPQKLAKTPACPELPDPCPYPTTKTWKNVGPATSANLLSLENQHGNWPFNPLSSHRTLVARPHQFYTIPPLQSHPTHQGQQHRGQITYTPAHHWDAGGSRNTYAVRRSANSAQRVPESRSNPGLCCCEAVALSGMSLRRPYEEGIWKNRSVVFAPSKSGILGKGLGIVHRNFMFPSATKRTFPAPGSMVRDRSGNFAI